MKTKLMVSFSLICATSLAGTGNTKDTDLAYLLILSVLGTVLLIWNSIDYISGNKDKLKSSFYLWVEKVKNYLSTFKKLNFSNSLHT